jgi:hypothetical protein
VEQTLSYQRVLPASILGRYAFAEVRNAAAALLGTNPAEFADVVAVLDGFWLTLDSLTDAGGSKSDIAADLDLAFRSLDWREAGHESKTLFTLNFSPYPPGTAPKMPISFEYQTKGHKVDNFHGRVALDVEWNAKDGNLDRDLANFRALHEVGVLDVGLIITRHHERTNWAANYLAEQGGRIRKAADGRRIILLGTTTTTNLEKLTPKLLQGAGGGCPILAVALTELCYRAGEGEPVLPPYSAPHAVPDPSQDARVVADEPEPDEPDSDDSG